MRGKAVEGDALVYNEYVRIKFDPNTEFYGTDRKIQIVVKLMDMSGNLTDVFEINYRKFEETPQTVLNHIGIEKGEDGVTTFYLRQFSKAQVEIISESDEVSYFDEIDAGVVQVVDGWRNCKFGLINNHSPNT